MACVCRNRSITDWRDLAVVVDHLPRSGGDCMKFNWRALLGGLGKAAEIAAPIVETKKPGWGKAIEIGGEAAKKASEKPEEPKK